MPTVITLGSASAWGFGYTHTPVSQGVGGGSLFGWGANNGEFNLDNSSYYSSPTQIGGSTKWLQVTTDTSNFSAAIKNDGTLWTWGSNSFGKLGANLDPSTVYFSTGLQKVGNSKDWLQVSAGQYHVAAIKTNNTLWVWGGNSSGQLGLGNFTNYSSPVQVGGSWKFVSAGVFFTVAIKTDNTLWAWGDNFTGQLGQGNLTSFSSPVQISGSWLTAVSGGGSVLGIKTNNKLYAWGDNSSGQLGLSDTTARSSPVQVGTDNWLSVMLNLTGGQYHALAIKTNNSLWSWGANMMGQLGLNSSGQSTAAYYYSSPKQVGFLTTWSKVRAGKEFSLAISTNGTLWAWGANGVGQLGLGNTTYYSSPNQIGTGTTWIDATANGYSYASAHALAIKT